MSDRRPPTRGRRALLWSVVVPPVGLVLGLVALARARGTYTPRSEAVLAVLNGLGGTAVLVAAVYFLPWFFRWYRDVIGLSAGWP